MTKKVNYPYFGKPEKNYERAVRILDGFNLNRDYLRDLVATVTGDEKYAQGLTPIALIHEGIKIRSVAEKIEETTQNKPRTSKKEPLEERVTDPITIISNTRFRALRVGDYSRYAAVCDYVGLVDVDDPFAYEKGKSNSDYDLAMERIDGFYNSLIKKSYQRDSYKNAIIEDEASKEGRIESRLFTKEFIPSTVRALRKEIKRVCGQLNQEPPKGLHSMKLNQLKPFYWRLRKKYFI